MNLNWAHSSISRTRIDEVKFPTCYTISTYQTFVEEELEGNEERCVSARSVRGSPRGDGWSEDRDIPRQDRLSLLDVVSFEL